LAIAWAYRSRGELELARRWLAKAKASTPGISATPLYTYLYNSIQLERDYLQKAQTWLRQAYDNGELRQSQRGAAAFNLGEIERRLGHSGSALQWYGEAEGRNLGSVSARLVERQRRLVETDSPYG
jgi:hypothetical protein